MERERVFVLDGGFATQLSVHVGAKIDGDPLWSARFNSTNPDSVVKTHLDFLKAGADAIVTNTYQASVEGFMKYLNLDEEQSIDLIKSTVKLAHKARTKFLNETGNVDKKDIPWIVGSIGPYGAHLHDASEYTGSYVDYVSPEEMKKWHRIRIDAILEAGVDALAIETIPSQIEAEAIIDLMYDEYPDVKFWISFQCSADGSTIAHGENFADTAKLIYGIVKERKMYNFLALGVNCLNPKYVSTLFKSLNGNIPEEKRIPLVCYPNSGEIYDVKTGWGESESCVPLADYVPEWIDLNVKFIGGCCRTYARDIQRIRDAIYTVIGNKHVQKK